jgi:hypothetical protein
MSRIHTRYKWADGLEFSIDLGARDYCIAEESLLDPPLDHNRNLKQAT